MKLLALGVPVVTFGTGWLAAWLSSRRNWKQSLRKKQLDAARRIVSAITKVQWAISDEFEAKLVRRVAICDDIEAAKAHLQKVIADSRLLLGEDIYRRLGDLLEAIDRDMDALSDDGHWMVGFTWKAVDGLMAALEELVPGLGFKPSKPNPFTITANRIIEYAAVWTPYDSTIARAGE